MEPAVLTPTDWSKVLDPVDVDDVDRYKMDNKLYVQFYSRPMIMKAESNEANRPIFRDIDHIRIMVPGDKLSIVDRIASEDDASRFADQWAKYKAGQSQEAVGTRLESVPWMTRSKVEEYKYFGIHTVEQLAGASDSVGQKFPGFHSDREKAKTFLEAASGTNARITQLEKMLEELQAKLSAPSKPVKEELVIVQELVPLKPGQDLPPKATPKAK